MIEFSAETQIGGIKASWSMVAIDCIVYGAMRLRHELGFTHSDNRKTPKQHHDDHRQLHAIPLSIGDTPKCCAAARGVSRELQSQICCD